MEVRQAFDSEIEVGAQLLYRKNITDLSAYVPTVVVVGFVPLCVGAYKRRDQEQSLSAVRQPDGQIVFAEDRQLFVEVKGVG